MWTGNCPDCNREFAIERKDLPTTEEKKMDEIENFDGFRRFFTTFVMFVYVAGASSYAGSFLKQNWSHLQKLAVSLIDKDTIWFIATNSCVQRYMIERSMVYVLQVMAAFTGVCGVLIKNNQIMCFFLYAAPLPLYLQTLEHLLSFLYRSQPDKVLLDGSLYEEVFVHAFWTIFQIYALFTVYKAVKK